MQSFLYCILFLKDSLVKELFCLILLYKIFQSVHTISVLLQGQINNSNRVYIQSFMLKNTECSLILIYIIAKIGNSALIFVTFILHFTPVYM